MKKLIYIGSIKHRNKKKTTFGGEHAKNIYILNYLKEKGFKISIVDIELYKTYNPINSLILILKLITSFLLPLPKLIIVSKYPIGGGMLLKFARILNIWRKKIIYIVIGGDIAEHLENGTLNIENFNFLNYILVESKSIKKKLEKLGFKNVLHMPNSKNVFEIKSNYSKPNDPLKLVYLSRIMPEKGIEFLIEALEKINKEKIKYTLDIYGPIDRTYDERRFLNLVKKNSKYISYKGFLDMSKKESYEILNMYDLFVFPTFFDGEGYPGALIDTMIAEVPVIASDWKYNSEIVNDRIGYLFETKNENDFIEKLEYIYNNKDELLEKRKNLKTEKWKYDNENVLSVLLDLIEI